jgi:PAS domain S-box-containing protein
VDNEELQLLVFRNENSHVSSVTEVLSTHHSGVKTSVFPYGHDIAKAFVDKEYGAALLFYPCHGKHFQLTLDVILKQHRAMPIIIVSETEQVEPLNEFVKSGVADYVLLKDLQRLPMAISNAIEKSYLKADQEKYFNELIARKTLMKDAERLAHFGSWRQDLSTGKLYWSDEKFRILGYSPGEVKPSWDAFYDRIHHEDAHFVRQTVDEVIVNRNRQKFTFRIVLGPSQVKYIHAEIYVTRNADLTVAQLNGFIRDISEHTKAEIRLVESEEKYRNLFENNPSALFVADGQTHKFRDVNRAAVNQYGYTREELLSLSVHDILPEERNTNSLQSLGRQPFANTNDVLNNRRKDGKVIKVEVTVSEIIYDGVPAWLIMANDVTDKLLTINRLKDSEARLITSQRIAHIGSWEMLYRNNQPDPTTTKWTDETYRIFGYKPNTMELTPDFQRRVIHKDDHALIDMSRASTDMNNREYSVEYRIILNDGSERIVSELGEISFNLITGEKTKLSGTIQDITEKKLAAELLSTSEANLRSIFENTETIYVLLDTDLNVVSFNQRAAHFAENHFEKRLTILKPAVSYFSDEMQTAVAKSLKKALDGNNLNFEVSFKDAKAITKWYNAHFHPVWSQDKLVIGVIMSFREITERKRAELQEKKITEDLIKRNKDLEQFAYIISHNLRAPVANIMGISQILSDPQIDDTERINFMEGLNDSIKKLDTVIIDLNRILQMKNEVNEVKETVNLPELVNDIKLSLSGQELNSMYSISTNFSAANHMVTLRSYLYSIFYNLISNSLKYKQPGVIPAINISSQIRDCKLILQFADNGLGIDLEKNGKQLFGLYKRFHQHAAEGKGVGLFMVKTQVETLGGSISVQSQVNVGTDFLIEFDLPEE